MFLEPMRHLRGDVEILDRSVGLSGLTIVAVSGSTVAEVLERSKFLWDTINRLL